jgi:hypothetical protein
MSDESRRHTDDAIPEGPWPPAGFLLEERLEPTECVALERRLRSERPGLPVRPWRPILAVAASLLLAAGFSILLTRPLPKTALPAGAASPENRSSVLRISRTDEPDRPPCVLEITYRPSSSSRRVSP